jgi:hypothetical protein
LFLTVIRLAWTTTDYEYDNDDDHGTRGQLSRVINK